MGVEIIRRSEQSVESYGPHQVIDYVNNESTPELSIAEINRVAPYDMSPSPFNQYYYVIEGEGLFEVEDGAYQLVQGDMFIVPKGTSYRTPPGVRLLCVTSPRYK